MASEQERGAATAEARCFVVVAGATIQHGRRGREAASLKPNGGTRRRGREEVKERTVRPEELAGLGGDLLLATRSSEAGIRPRGPRACNEGEETAPGAGKGSKALGRAWGGLPDGPRRRRRHGTTNGRCKAVAHRE